MEISKQKDSKDCGIVIVKTFYEYFYKKIINYNQIKVEAIFAKNGISVANLILLFKKFNIKAKAFYVKFNELIKSNYNKYFCTMIKKENYLHYVIAKIDHKNEKTLILDPSNGKKKYITLKRFQKIYCDIFIEINKIKTSKKNKKTKNINLFSYSYYFLSSYIIIFISFILDLGINFANGFYLKLILDTVYQNQDYQLLLTFFLIFLYLAIIQILNIFIKNIFFKRIEKNVFQNLFLGFFNKLENVKIKKIFNFTNDEIIKKMTLISEVSNFISKFIIIVFNQVFCLIISCLILIWINSNLFWIIFLITLLKLLFSYLKVFFLKDKQKQMLNKEVELLNISLDQINLIKQKFYYEKKYQVEKQLKFFQKFNQNNYQLWKKGNYFELINYFIDFTIPLLIIFLGMKEIIQNDNSLSSLLLFLNFYVFFNSSINGIFNFMTNYSINVKKKDLLEIIFLLPQEKKYENKISKEKIKQIKIFNLNFKLEKTIFKINNILILKDTQIIGKNGCGKTTFLKLIATHYFSDNIFYNNKKINYFNLKSLRKKIFIYQPQNFFIYDTVFNYITLNNQKAIIEFNKNLSNYNLQKLFQDLNIDLGQKIINNGENLSSGQKQIIALMRLFAFKFDLILLDESFENIDTEKSQWLTKALKQIQDGIFIEISHSKTYVGKLNEVKLE